MPLKALYNLYNRKIKEGDMAMPQVGYVSAPVSFAVLLSGDGKLLNLLDLRVDGKPVAMQIPEQVKRTVGCDPNFLCDNLNYVFGIDSKGKPERVQNCFDSFVRLHVKVLKSTDDAGAQAVVRFYRGRSANTQEPEIRKFLEDLMKGGNIIFKLEGDTCFIHQRPEIKQAWENYYLSKGSGYTAQCLITGEKGEISNIHLRANKNINKEVFTVSLNETAGTPYRLGRLFAVLEKAQKEAIPGISATIKDMYYSSASSTPALVFPRLVRLAQSHISKLDYGYKYDEMIGKIVSEIKGFPATLNLNEQGEFILGYYHQREDFYIPKKNKENQ